MPVPEIQGPSLRGSGRTHRMMLELPDDGHCIVVVAHPQQDRYLRDMIWRHRPALMSTSLRIMVIRSVVDADRWLRGVSMPVYADHFFWEDRTIRPEVKQRVGELMRIYGDRWKRKEPTP